MSGSHMIDSLIFRDVYGTETMRDIFKDTTVMQNWLDIEVALAETQSELGIIPKEAAIEIRKKCKVELLDLDEIRINISKIGHSLVPTLRAVEAICENGYGEYIHLGVTTQDILDTGHMMSIKRAYDVIYQDLLDIEVILMNMIIDHRDTLMIGRTHGQHALPITFGFKVASWAGEVRRHIERMEEARERVLVGEICGAVGSMAGFNEHALEVSNKTIEKVGLNVPDIAWQSSRDRIVEITNILALACASFGKIANEIVNSQKTEMSELAEGFTKGQVGSSTMPHKRNPGLSEGIVTLSKVVKSSAYLTYESMYSEHERDGALWKIEWLSVGETMITAGGVIAKSKKLLENLVVFEDKMRSNVNMLKGLILSEPLMLALGEKLGKQTAHEIIYEISMETFEQDEEFAEMLLKNENVKNNFTRDEIKNILDPAGYLGQCGYFCDKVVNIIKEARGLGTFSFKKRVN